jgi:predicted nuclease of restriction endonuclease-like (RecB) superfamily
VSELNDNLPADANDQYEGLIVGISHLLKEARQNSVRSVNSIMTATYWEIGRRIVEFEQGGEERAEYGTGLVKRLARDLKARFGRGFSQRNVEQMRRFYLLWPIAQTLSAQSEGRIQTPPEEMPISDDPEIISLPGQEKPVIGPNEASALINPKPKFPNRKFPLPWSHYVRLLKVDGEDARNFYEAEALRGGWSVRQLDRQIGSLFYQRTAMSTNKQKMLTDGSTPQPGEVLTPEQQIKDPMVLEFLNLKDEYSESDLEEAIIFKLEEFLLELGSDFAFVGRQKRLRIGDHWFRIDLLFFHRRLRCLVVIDLKIGEFSHADAGQMHMYLNYVAEHWTNEDENPPVGIILCAERDEAVAHYALDGLPNQVLASEYRLALPEESVLAEEVKRVQQEIASRQSNPSPPQ